MASATQLHRGATLLLLSAVLLLASSMSAVGAGSCADDKLPANRSYAHCAALGPLGATLHWTYDAKHLLGTDLAADESGGEVRLYGKLQLRPGMEVVNHIWNVGSTVADGAPVKHALAQENLDARGKLVLSAGTVLGPAPEPAPAAPGGGSSVPKNSSGGAAPPPSADGKSTGAAAAAASYVSAPVLMLLAFAGFVAVA
ncbi:unnamed protein product [Urochloa decumbens]|uniref:AIR12 DOMON domain-containing protein n=1 Tax=Urochloa decumbens TaxID=240449 RepID=A0ABC9FTV1_9POAL